jgi:hypothetical protein
LHAANALHFDTLSLQVDLFVLALLATQLIDLILHRLHVFSLTLVHINFGVFDLGLPLLALLMEISVSCLEPLALSLLLDNGFQEVLIVFFFELLELLSFLSGLLNFFLSLFMFSLQHADSVSQLSDIGFDSKQELE